MENTFQISRHSVHYFQQATLNEEQYNKLLQILAKYDCFTGPSGQKTRITLTNNHIGKAYLISNELGWIIASAYIPENKQVKNIREQIECDLGYKLYMISIELSMIGIATCFATYSLNQDKLSPLMKKLHPMGYIAPIALAFGIEPNSKPFCERLISIFLSSSSRMPISDFFTTYDSKAFPQKYQSALNAVQRAPSVGNTQTWKIYYTRELEKSTDSFSFYAVSEIESRFLNVGCAMAAFEMSQKGGSWSLLHTPIPEQDFCFTYSFSH